MFGVRKTLGDEGEATWCVSCSGTLSTRDAGGSISLSCCWSFPPPLQPPPRRHGVTIRCLVRWITGLSGAMQLQPGNPDAPSGPSTAARYLSLIVVCGGGGIKGLYLLVMLMPTTNHTKRHACSVNSIRKIERIN